LEERAKRHRKLAEIKPKSAASTVRPASADATDAVPVFKEIQARHASIPLTSQLRDQFFLPQQLFIVTGKRRVPVHALGSHALAAQLGTTGTATTAIDADRVDEGGMADDDVDDGSDTGNGRSQRARDRELADTDVSSELADLPTDAIGTGIARPNRSVVGFVQDSSVLASALQDSLGRLRPRLTVLESRINPGQFLIPHHHLTRHLRALWKTTHQLLPPLPLPARQTAGVPVGTAPNVTASTASTTSPVDTDRKSPAVASSPTHAKEADDEDAVVDIQERQARLRSFAAPAPFDLDPAARTSDGRPRDLSERDRRRRLQREQHLTARHTVRAANTEELKDVPRAMRKRVRDKAKQVLAEPTQQPESGRRPGSGQSVPSQLLQSLQTKLHSISTDADTVGQPATAATPSRRA
jgi:hypothetical protein